MQNRRQHETPFQATGTEIKCAAGKAIVVADSPELAKFIERACNRYDALMAMHDLCRGNLELATMPYRFPADKAFHKLSEALLSDVAKNGR